MTVYLPSPAEAILASREDGRDTFGVDLLAEGLKVNWRKMPWRPSPMRPDSQVMQLQTLGDPDFEVRRFLADAMVPSAHAEKEHKQTKERAARYLEELDGVLDDKTRTMLTDIAGQGRQPDPGGFAKFLSLIDTPAQILRLGVGSATGLIEGVSTQDYIDTILQRDEEIKQRLGVDQVGEGPWLALGGTLLENSYLENHPSKGVMGFLFDVVLDPITYVSWGTLGFGKRAAMAGAAKSVHKMGSNSIRAVEKGTVSSLRDPGEKHLARQIQKRIDDALEAQSKMPGSEAVGRLHEREAIKRRILLEEKQAVDLTGTMGGRGTFETIPKEVPLNTVVGRSMDNIWRLQADKQFRTLSREMPWFYNSTHTPRLSKGGFGFSPPFARKRFEGFRIPGTQTDRLVTRPIRAVTTPAFNKMPPKWQEWFRSLGARAGVEYSAFARARVGELWSTEAAEAATKNAMRANLSQVAADALGDGNRAIREAFKKAGKSQDEADEAIIRALTGDADHIDHLPADLQETVHRHVFGDAEEGVLGIKSMFEAFRDAAHRVGMELGDTTNYFPMVLDSKFADLLEALTRQGIKLRIGDASSTDARVGMELISRLLNTSAERTLGTAGKNLGHTQFADATIVTAIHRNALAGHELARDYSLLEMFVHASDALTGATGRGKITPLQANKAIAAAVEEMVDTGILTRIQAESFTQAFITDVADVARRYIPSMNQAIQYRYLMRQFKRLDLVNPAGKMVDRSATLASVQGSLTEPMMRLLDMLVSTPGAQVASRMVTVRIGGRAFRVPATVAASEGFEEASKRLGKVLARADKRQNEMGRAVEEHAALLVSRGVDEETALRAAMGEADKEFAQAIADIIEAGVGEVEVLRRGVIEMAAKGHGNADDLFRAGEAEARRLIRGVNETITELETSLRQKLNIRDPAGTGRAIDLLDPANAPKGHPTPIQAWARWAQESMDRKMGQMARAAAEAAEGGPALRGASRGDIAREAVGDLSDRLTIGNVTVGDLADFSSPRVAARVVHDAHVRLVDDGWEGLRSWNDDLGRAVDKVFDAEDTLVLAHEAGDGVEAALKALRRAESELDNVAGTLRQSDEQLGDVVEHLMGSVMDINDPILMAAPEWAEVWAVSIHRTGGLPRAEYAVNMAQAEAKGLPRLTQKQLTGQNSKGAARESADLARELWQRAATAQADAVTERGAMAILQGHTRLRRAMEAMASGDERALPAYMDEIRQIVGTITDEAGRPIFDASRLQLRNGRLVYEPAQISFVTLDDVMPDIRRIVANADVDDMEALRILKNTWDENPRVIEEASSSLGDFMRQLDANGGLPTMIEDYQYLRGFAANLEQAAATLGHAATAPRVQMIRGLLNEVNAVLKGTKKTTRRLESIWNSSRDELHKALPQAEFDRLADLVGTAELASVGMRPSPVRNELRQLIGEVEQTMDLFTMDIAAMNRLANDAGHPWAASVVEDMIAFRRAMGELITFSDDLSPAIREGFQGLEGAKGPLTQTLGEARKAGRRLVSRLEEAKKDPRLAEFLPIPPRSRQELLDHLPNMRKAIASWEPVSATVTTPGKVKLSVAHLVGEQADDLVTSPAMAQYLENMAATALSLTGPEGIRMIAESARSLEKWWKAAATVARPTFVPRNIMGGVINGLIANIGPSHYNFIGPHMIEFRRLTRSGLSPDQAIAQLPEKVRPYMQAIWDSEILFKTFSHTLEGLRTRTQGLRKFNVLGSENALFETGARFMRWSEDLMRGAAFVRWYDPSNPGSAMLAREMTMAIHFDYAALTRMETSIKKFVPFFIWTRRNVPLQVRAVMEQPGHVMRIKRFMDNLDVALMGDGDNFVDDIGFGQVPYMGSFFARTPLIFDEDTPYWQRLILRPDLPVTDLEEILRQFSRGPGGWSEYIWNQLSPTYSAPMRLFQDDYDAIAPTGLREIMMAVDTLTPFDPAKSGDQYIVNSILADLGRNFPPFLGEWTRTFGIMPSAPGQRARFGFTPEDGVEASERLKASALTLARGLGAHLQTPGDTRSEAGRTGRAMTDAISRLRRTQPFGDEDEMAMLLQHIMAREGIDIRP